MGEALITVGALLTMVDWLKETASFIVSRSLSGFWEFPHLVYSRLSIVLVQLLVDKPIVMSMVSSESICNFAENEESRVPTTIGNRSAVFKASNSQSAG